MNNAIDAIKRRIQSGEIEKGYIHITIQILGDDGVIAVTDNGGGISDDIVDKIFNPYFTTKHDSYGTGIGLYIAKNIIESRMRGTLSVKNCDEGSCFMINIPNVNQIA